MRNRRKKKAIPKLDLHQVRHEDVRGRCIEFVEANWDTGEEIHIITGYSDMMMELVIQVLKEYNLRYEEGDCFNKGYIKSWL